MSESIQQPTISRCYTCTGKLQSIVDREFRKRFTNNVQRYLCEVCADEANDTIATSRNAYGISSRMYNRQMKKFKKKHKIPLYGILNAKHQEMVNQRHELMIRFMLYKDYVSIRNWLKTYGIQ